MLTSKIEWSSSLYSFWGANVHIPHILYTLRTYMGMLEIYTVFSWLLYMYSPLFNQHGIKTENWAAVIAFSLGITNYFWPNARELTFEVELCPFDICSTRLSIIL